MSIGPESDKLIAYSNGPNQTIVGAHSKCTVYHPMTPK